LATVLQENRVDWQSSIFLLSLDTFPNIQTLVMKNAMKQSNKDSHHQQLNNKHEYSTQVT